MNDTPPKFVYMCPTCFHKADRNPIRITCSGRAFADPSQVMMCASCNTPVQEYLKYQLKGKIRLRRMS